MGRLLEPDQSVSANQYSFVNALKFRVRFDYSAAATQRSVEDSLQRLGLATIDIVLIHDVGQDTHGPAWRERFDEAMAGAAVALTRMREQGLIRAWGLGVNVVEPCLLTLEQADPDLFLLAGRYTLLDHTDGQALLRACARREVKLIIGGPYNSGLLAGGSTFDYVAATPAMIAKRDQIWAICQSHGVALKAAALQFCAAPDEVASVIPGGRSAQEIMENAALMTQEIPDAFWRALKDQKLIPEDIATPG